MKKYPTLIKLLGNDWISYMIECEASRPAYYKKLSYVGRLSELEDALEILEGKSIKGFESLVHDLKKGMSNKSWEDFEHAFALAKEASRFKNKKFKIEFNPEITIGNKKKNPDFRVKYSNQWTYFEVKASPMFSGEGEFILHFEDPLGKKIKIIDSPYFYLIVFSQLDFKARQVDETMDVIKNITQKTSAIKNPKFPISYLYPSDNPKLQLFVFDPKKTLSFPEGSDEKQIEFTKFIIKDALEHAGEKNYYFIHAPTDYDLRKRLRNLIKKIHGQIPKNKCNVFVLYTREVVLGNEREIKESFEEIFTVHDFYKISGGIINIELVSGSVIRRSFLNKNTRIPVQDKVREIMLANF